MTEDRDWNQDPIRNRVALTEVGTGAYAVVGLNRDWSMSHLEAVWGIFGISSRNNIGYAPTHKRLGWKKAKGGVVSNYYSSDEVPTDLRVDAGFLDHSREIISELLNETVKKFGWWGYQTWWVRDGKLVPDNWVIPESSPASLSALGAIRARAIEVRGMSYQIPALVNAEDMHELQPDAEIYSVAGARHFAAFDTSGMSEFAVRTIFLLPTASALSEESIQSLLTAAFILPKIFRQERARAELFYRSTHDVLTGLPNRRGLDIAIHNSMLAGNQATRAVAYLDLDHFKSVNDTLGHDVGDELLSYVAKQLTANLRPTDFVARLGGDEFIIVAHNVNTSAEGHMVARRLTEAVDGTFTSSAGNSIAVRCSTGVALWRTSEPFTDSLKLADSLMYQAKQVGGGIVVEDLSGNVSYEDPAKGEYPQVEDALGKLTEITTRSIIDNDTGLRWGQYVELDTAMRNLNSTELVNLLVTNLTGYEHGTHSVTHVVMNLPSQFWLKDSLMPEIMEQLRTRIPTISLSVLLHCEVAVGPVLEIAHEIQSRHNVGIFVSNFGNGINELSVLDSLTPLGIVFSPDVIDSLSTPTPKMDSLRISVSIARTLGLLTLALDVRNEFVQKTLTDLHCDLTVGTK